MTRTEHRIALKKWRTAPRRHEKKGLADSSRNALVLEALSSILVSIIFVGSAGWWMLENCREADRLVKEYSTMLAEAEKNGTVENFLKLR